MFRRLKPHQLVVDVSLAALFFLVGLPIELVIAAPDQTFPGSAATSAVAISLLFSGAIAVSRLAPGLALAVAWIAAIVQMAAGRPPSFVDLAVFVVLFAVGAYGTPHAYWAGLASAILGALVITVYLLAGPVFSAQGPSWSSVPTALLVLVAAAFALGLSWTVGALVRTARRARENREAQERAEAEAVVEQERVRIARDMHDVVAHSLAVVVAQADGARYAAAADPSAATTALGTISATARAALADVRLLLEQLRHSQGVGPQPTLADLEQLYARMRAAGVQLRIDVDPAPPGIPPAAVQLAVYRILQEALTNALRHGREGGPVDVRLAWLPGGVDLEVGNPLVATGANVRRPGGHGLVGMAERAQLAGGRLDAAEEGDRFVVRAHLPIGGAR